MTLSPGDTLGSYRITGTLGSGGMGEVYAAEDLRLHRVIALKILSVKTVEDPELRRRFEREARAVAALNHPNIVTIHSVEQDGDLPFLTMELVEGKSVAELIPTHGMAVQDLLRVAIPLADAIGAAHHRGITHRDLKPANLMIADDGRLKVLDFGLAKLRDDDGGDHTAVAEMATVPITGEGRILGTVAYMSPEQAEGKPIDHRSDIFSIGTILYEMATGDRPFTGETSLSVLSAILRDTPRPATEINPFLPHELGRIIKRCLVKDPEHRYQSAKDLRNALEELKQALESGELSTAVPISPGLGVSWRAPAVVLGLVIVAGLVALWSAKRTSTGRSQGPVSATFTQITSRRGVEQFPSLSPDGKWLAYNSDASGNHDIYLQSTGGQTTINLTKESTGDEWQPSFSPDGDQIVFRSSRSGGGLFVMGRTGEALRRITDSGFNPAWSPTGEEIVFATEGVDVQPANRGVPSALWVVNVATGAKRELRAGEDAMQPSWSPHGHRIAFWTAHGPGRQRDLATIPAAGGEPLLVTDDAALDWSPVWSPDGGSLYFSSSRNGTMNLWRVAIDERSGRTLGVAVPIAAPTGMAGQISLSASGTQLAFTSIEVNANLQQIGFDPVTGTAIGEPTWITSGSKRWAFGADVSPDGQMIAISSDASAQEDLYVIGWDGTGLRQLTSDAAFDRTPKWSPDGKRIAFQSNRGGGWDLWAINVDGSGLTQLTRGIGAHVPVWSPDGSRMAYYVQVSPRSAFLFDVLRPWEQQRPEPFPDGAPGWIPINWSPDGKWIAGGVFAGNDGTVVLYSLETRSYTTLKNINGDSFWLHDGRRLLVNNSDGKVVLVDRVSMKVTEVLTTSAPDEFRTVVAVSPDDRRLVLSRWFTSGDIWLATLK